MHCEAALAAYAMVLCLAPKQPPFDSPVRYTLANPANNLRVERLPIMEDLANQVSAPGARARLEVGEGSFVYPRTHLGRTLADFVKHV